MMTNPECILVDGGSIKFRGTIEEVGIYLDGYSDAVLDVQLDEYLDELASRAAFADWLAEEAAHQAKVDADDWDDDEFLEGLASFPTAVSLGPVVLAETVETPADQDHTQAYADVSLVTEPETPDADEPDADEPGDDEVPNAYEAWQQFASPATDYAYSD